MDFLRQFKENVKKHNSKIAIRFGYKEISYGELDLLSDSIVGLLAAKGVKKNTFVGVLMKRSLDVPIAILGILKYGCGFLPIDSEYPSERIKYIVKDSELSCIICNVEKQMEMYSQCVMFELLDNMKGTYGVPQCAYMIYTSGSTGKPKGVIIGYQSLNNVLESFKKIININDEDVLFAITTFSFDISILELLLPLYVGAEVVISDKRAQIDSVYLRDQLLEYKVTFMQATPVTWDFLLDSGWKNETNITVLCGGEALNTTLAEKLTNISTSVWNLYGPTETTIWSSAYKVVPNAPISIGNPIDNTYFKIMDENMCEATEGELYIGGIGVSEGYWHREQLNNEKFMYIDGIMYYATGDIVKYDGCTYYFVCRKDYQVKINGHRIELGEIESVILSMPEIKETVVLYEKNRLVAIIQEKCPINDNDLYTYISEILPNYMIPQEVIRLSSFPLTDNKKVNRKKIRELIPEVHIDENSDIYTQGLSSYSVMCLIAQYAKKGFTLSVEDLFAGKPIKEAIKSYVVLKNNNFLKEVDAWELQKQMTICRLFYPDLNMYYEKCVLHFVNQSQEYLIQRIESIINKLDISKVSVQYVRGIVKWYWSDKNIIVRKNSTENIIYKDRSLFNIEVKENGDVFILYHHSLIDGESIRSLVKIIFNYVNNVDVNIEDYNGFLDTTFMLNRLCNVKYPKYEIPKFFTGTLPKSTDLIGTVNFSIQLRNLHNILRQFKGNMASYLHYVVAKAISAISNEKIVYSSINSNRLLLNNSKVLGNFININHMEFQRRDLESADLYMEKYKCNMGLCNHVYNSQNKYEINLIINDYRNDQEYINMVEQKVVELNLCYEDNNFPINIRFDILKELHVNISYGNIQNDIILKTFFSEIEKEIMVLGK